MTLRRLVPLTTLTLSFVSFGTGCQHSAAAASPPDAPQAQAPFATPPVLPGTPDVATLVAKVKPSVVNITTVQEVKVGHAEPFGGFGEMFPFLRRGPGGRQFGGGGDEEGDQVTKQQALGSGFIIDAQGHVVTNAHVVDGANTVKVKLADDREYHAKVIGKDDRLDVAVLALDNPPQDLPVAALGASEVLRVGEYVVAIGNPFGLGDTVTMGIVSAKGRTIGAGPYDDFIQTDASINPGNSGGPLFNLLGQVVGINTAINPQGKGIGFALPIDMIKQVLPQLIATGHVSRGRIGAVIQGMDADLAHALGLDHPHGALVEEVEQGSPAEKAGIKSGDVILAVEGQQVPHSSDLPRMIATHAPGSQVKLRYLRDKQEREATVTLAPLEGEQPNAQGSQPRRPANDNGHAPSSLGISVADDDGHVTVQRVDPSGPADGKLRPGDVIEEIDQQPVTSSSDLSGKIHAAPADKPLLLRVRHGDQSRFVAIERTRAE